MKQQWPDKKTHLFFSNAIEEFVKEFTISAPQKANEVRV